jgi:large-conductance mechanosensitive channel
MDDFTDFLLKYNIVTIVFASAISERVSEIVSDAVDCLILPIVNRDADGDGINDIVKIEDKILKVYGINIKIGKMVVTFVKFIIILFIIYKFSNIINKKNN